MNYTLLGSTVMAILIAITIGYGLSDDSEKEIIEEEEEVDIESRWFSHQFNNVSGAGVINETIYNGSCNVQIDISVKFDSEWGNFTLLVNDEQLLHTKNNTSVEVAGNNLTITIRAIGGDEHPDNAMADYFIVNMVSRCS
jgi:hypothetical protein